MLLPFKKSSVLITLRGPNHGSFAFKVPIPHSQRLIDASEAGLITGSFNLTSEETDCPDTFVETKTFHAGVDSIIDGKPAALQALEEACGSSLPNTCSPRREHIQKSEHRKPVKKFRKKSKKPFPKRSSK